MILETKVKQEKENTDLHSFFLFALFMSFFSVSSFIRDFLNLSVLVEKIPVMCSSQRILTLDVVPFFPLRHFDMHIMYMDYSGMLE